MTSPSREKRRNSSLTKKTSFIGSATGWRNALSIVNLYNNLALRRIAKKWFMTIFRV